MKEESNGAEKARDAQAEERPEKPQAQSVGADFDVSAYEAQIAEHDGRIKELEEQIAGAAKTAETAEQLKAQIEELKAQGEDQRIEFELRLAGVRSVKAARAVLDDHGGDVAALKEAEPWLFGNSSAKPQGGKTGLPNAGAAKDADKQMREWREIAGLTDEE